MSNWQPVQLLQRRTDIEMLCTKFQPCLLLTNLVTVYLVTSPEITAFIAALYILCVKCVRRRRW